MKKLFFISLIFSVIIIQAQDTTKYWNKGGDIALNFSQVSFTNWAAGGDNSIGINGMLNLFANYKKDVLTWDNSLQLAYGTTKINDADFRKSDDKIDLASKLGYALNKKLSIASLLSFKSQMAAAYEFPEDADKIEISNFLAPGYLSLGVGIDYKPNDFFSFYYSPVSARLVIVNNDDLVEKYGLEAGTNSKFELGSLAKFAFKKDIVKNVGLQTTLQLFSNYLKEPQNVDIDWEVLINMKINEYLSANLNTNVLYDDDILITDKNGKTGPRTQFKQLFGVGFSVKF